MKKKAIVAIALLLCILCVNYALAVSHPLSPFTVTTKTTQYITNEAKADNQQKWFVTILSMSITENDELYMNVRDARYGNKLSHAIRFRTAAAKSADYDITTVAGQRIYLHAQLGSKNWTPDSFVVVSSGRWSP